MQSQKHFSRDCWVKAPGRLVNNEKRRRSQKGRSEGDLPLVAPTQLVYLLFEVLFQVKELSQVEYLLHALSEGKSFELSHAVQLEEGRETLLQVVFVQTHSHLQRGQRKTLKEVSSKDITYSREGGAVDASEQTDELRLPSLSWPIEGSHTPSFYFDFVFSISRNMGGFNYNRRGV